MTATTISVSKVQCEEEEEDEAESSGLWKKNVLVNYSTANEYYAANYGHTGNRNPYFITDSTDGTCSVDVYDARHGVFRDSSKQQSKAELHAPLLERDGFTLSPTLPLPSTSPKRIMSMNEIRDSYLPQLREMMHSQLDGTIDNILFWYPMIRSDAVPEFAEPADEEKLKTGSVAGMVHIDTDVGAHTAQSIASLIYNNMIPEEDNGAKSMEEIAQAIDNGQRFVIVNAWRNIDPYNEPITRYPLGIQPATYVQQPHSESFPKAKIDQIKSPWYVFSEMATNEVLLFKQYDRLADRPSDIWHIGLPVVEDNGTSMNGMPARRTSLVVSAFVLFQDKATPDQDRFHAQRIRPQWDE